MNIFRIAGGILAVAFLPRVAPGAEIQGKVVEVQGDVVTVVTDRGEVPRVGDKVEIIFQLPGLDDVARIGSGQVTEIRGKDVLAKIDQRTGKLAKGQQARLTTSEPTKTGPPKPSDQPVDVQPPPTIAKPPSTPADNPLSAAVDSARTAAWRTTSSNNLKQIGLAIHGYHSAYFRLPSDIYGPDRKPLLSWRVVILPYLEQDSLYRQFKLDEPWDSPLNRRLLAQMPQTYAGPGAKTPTAGETLYQRFTGPRTVFEGDQSRKLTDITDGLSRTLMAAEAGEPVLWTKPADLAFDPAKPLPRLGGLFSDGFHGLFADGAVRFYRKQTSDQLIRAFITRNGGEVISEGSPASGAEAVPLNFPKKGAEPGGITGPPPTTETPKSEKPAPPPTRPVPPLPTPAVPRGAAPVVILFSDSFHRADSDSSGLGQADLSLGGSGNHFYIPVGSNGARIVRNVLENGGLDYSGVQFAAQPGGRGENVGQDLNIKVDLLVPTDAAGDVTQAGPYFRSRAAAAGDGLIGGTSAGYWVRLHSTGGVTVKRLNPQAVVAFSAVPVAFDPRVVHTLEMAAQGNSLQVALDGRSLTFVQDGTEVVSVRLAPAWEGPPPVGFNQGTAGILFGAEDNRGKIGGQQASNLVVSGFHPL